MFGYATTLRSMSQGRLTQYDAAGSVSETWTIDKPQEDIYLIAGPFKSYTATAGAVQAVVLLRQDDAPLARSDYRPENFGGEFGFYTLTERVDRLQAVFEHVLFPQR